MKRYTRVLLLVLLAVVVAGCSSANRALNFEQAMTLNAAEAIAEPFNVKYNFRLGVGQHEGESLWLHGAGTSSEGIWFAVAQVLEPTDRNIRGVEFAVWNNSNGPVTIFPDQFNLLSPEGRVYSYDWDYNWDAKIKSNIKSVLLTNETVQPDEVRRFIMYYRVGRDAQLVEDLWRFVYSTRDRGFFSPSVALPVFALPVYSTEPIN